MIVFWTWWDVIFSIVFIIGILTFGFILGKHTRRADG